MVNLSKMKKSELIEYCKKLQEDNKFIEKELNRVLYIENEEIKEELENTKYTLNHSQELEIKYREQIEELKFKNNQLELSSSYNNAIQLKEECIEFEEENKKLKEENDNYFCNFIEREKYNEIREKGIKFKEENKKLKEELDKYKNFIDSLYCKIDDLFIRKIDI